jgi:CMP-N,N'-diacetyllegionaminic acid synthase
MKTIATICARGGSQGLPRKNILPLLGKPLIGYTIEQALSCKLIDKVFVSTDDEEIAEVALQFGAIVPFIRPKELATSSAPKVPVIQHLVEWVTENHGQPQKIIDLDPTSPLRRQEDIEACLNLLDDASDVVITAYESTKNPYFNMVEYVNDGHVKLVKENSNCTSRQSAPKVYSMNASIYVWHYHTLHNGLWNGKSKMYVMPYERSVDIDSYLDFKLVELIMKERLAVS